MQHYHVIINHEEFCHNSNKFYKPFGVIESRPQKKFFLIGKTRVYTFKCSVTGLSANLLRVDSYFSFFKKKFCYQAA